MYSENLLEQSSLIERGFLSNKSLEILSENRRLSDEDLILLNDGLNLIKVIIKGKNQTDSGKLGDDSLNAASAYSSTLIALISIDKRDVNRMGKLIIDAEQQLNRIIKDKKVETKNTNEIRIFFRAILNLALNDINKNYYKNSEETEWMKPLF